MIQDATTILEAQQRRFPELDVDQAIETILCHAPTQTDAPSPAVSSTEPRHGRCGLLRLGRIAEAANDDDGVDDVPLLQAALRLTHERGGAAARFAHVEVERAYFSGGGVPYRWWLTLTRVLDRMLAADFGAIPAITSMQIAGTPSYSQVRRDMAKRIGLGRKAASAGEPAVASAAPEPQQADEAPPAKPARGRRRKAEAETA